MPSAVTAPRTLWFASAGLEVSCLYAWCAFTLMLASQPIASALSLFATFACASLANTALRQRQFHASSRSAVAASASLAPQAWRLEALENALLLAAALPALWLVRTHTFWYSGQVLWSTAWLTELLQTARPARAWAALGGQLLWTGAFWCLGAVHGARERSHRALCARFDRGLLWLFALLGAKLLLRGQPGIQLDDSIASAALVPFFCFSLVAIALARNHTAERKSFLPGYRSYGPLTTFGAGIVLCSSGVVSLCLPYLRDAAQLSYQVLRGAGGPVANLFADFILWLIDLSNISERSNSMLLLEERNDSVKVHPGELLRRPMGDAPEPLLLWLIAGAVTFAVGALVVWIVWRRWRRRSNEELAWAVLTRWFQGWLARLRALFTQTPEHDALRLYARLRRWGARSGMPSRGSETPLEYGRRLQAQLTLAAPDIEPIILAFQAHVYGPELASVEHIARARSAMRRLHRPQLWPQRIELRLRSGEPPEPAGHLYEHVIVEAPRKAV
jgi:hypothetical protein